MSYTPNGSILPCVRAFHKINRGYAVHCTVYSGLLNTMPSLLHSALDGKVQRNRFAHVRNCIHVLASQKYVKQV